MAEAAPPPPVAPAPRRRARAGCLKVAVLLVLLAGGALALYTWAVFQYDFSEGQRAGYVQKFSRKGWICKTWEGELAMANLPGAMPEIFAFTVRDDEVAARINASMGQRVALTYEQHRGLPTTCFGETQYFVTDVRPAPP
jgi:hypothetical protein